MKTKNWCHRHFIPIKTALNINSLLKHMDELRILISNSTIVILAINESKIDDSVFDNEINIIGYNMIRNDRNRSGGGVVLYIRHTISFSERKDLVPEPLEMICIEVRRPHKMAFLVSAWYRPPNSMSLTMSLMNLIYFCVNAISKIKN